MHRVDIWSPHPSNKAYGFPAKLQQTLQKKNSRKKQDRSIKNKTLSGKAALKNSEKKTDLQ